MLGVYRFRKGVRQTNNRSFKVGINEKRGSKNIKKFDSGYEMERSIKRFL
jgi:hypothetical protein